MRRLAIILGLLLCGLPARAAITITQTVSAQTVGTQTAVTVASTGSAHLIAVGIYSDVTGSSLSVTDGGSQTYIQAACNTVGNGKACVFYKENSASGVTQVNCNNTNSGTLPCTVYEIAGTATSSSLDTTAVSANAASGGTLTSGTFTTTNANDILLYYLGKGANEGAGACSAVWSAGANYSLPVGSCATSGRGAMQNRIVTTTQVAITTTLGGTVNSIDRIGIFVAFADTPVTPGGCKSRIALLGAGC